MSHWSIEMIRQSGWDLWVIVCAAASLVLLAHAFLWKQSRNPVSLLLIAIGIAGTVLVLAVAPLHSSTIGLVWTLLLLSILSATFYLNLRERLTPRRITALLTMRICSLAVLVPMLFEPVIRYTFKPKPEHPLFFLIDTSGSMSFPDVQNGPTRLQSVWQALRPQLDRINEHFVPTYFTFDTSFHQLEKPEALANLQADGKATDMVNGVNSALSKSTRNDTQLVIITDGIDNVSANVPEALRAAHLPINTVDIGSDQTEPAAIANVAVDSIEAPDDYIVNHDATVKATILSTALANRVVDVNLSEIDDAGKAMGETKSQRLILQPTPRGQTVELTCRLTTPGVHRLAVWIDPIPGERSVIDNRQEFQALAIDPRIKVLYIEGRARPEFRELNRAMGRDPNIELATLLRIQQERFAAAGTIDGQDFKTIPANAGEWSKIDVILLGDLDSSFLSRAQQSNIEQRVAAGAGLLMMGGQNSFGPGGYHDSPIEKTLPVFVGDLHAEQDTSEFVPRQTADGLTHPILEGLGDWFGTENVTAKNVLPNLRGNVVVPRSKSGAQILLVHQDQPGPDGKPQIVLATQLYGKGRSAAFTVDTTYLWYLPLRGLGQDSPYNRLWGQLVRWLAGQDVRNRQRGAGMEALLNKSIYQLGESVKIRAMVRDDRGDATRYAEVISTVTKNNDPKPATYTLAPSESQAGMYEQILASPAKGDYEVELVAKKDNKELGREKLKFTVIPPADEMFKIAANPKLLAAIAEQTHGFHYELGQLPALIDQLIREEPQSAIARQKSVPLSNYIRAIATLAGSEPQWSEQYDLPMQGSLVIILLAAEWFLRRRWQLN